jgi:hypothetical protein
MAGPSLAVVVTAPTPVAKDFRSLSHLRLTSRWPGQRLAVLDVRGFGVLHIVGFAHVPRVASHGLTNLVSSFEIATKPPRGRGTMVRWYGTLGRRNGVGERHGH